MTDFHFLRPWWLLALLPIAALIWSLHRRRRAGGDWQDFCDPALLPHILVDSPSDAARRPLWLAGLAGTLAVLALAGPVWERLPAPAFRNLSALVVVLDLSQAMDAADLKPNRISLARFKIEDILRARKDGQTALVVYAGEAFTVTPLTDDTATIVAQLGALVPEVMPVQGDRPDLGLEAAARLLRQAGLNAGDILWVAGGTGEGDAGASVAKLRREGYRVSVLGVGTLEGAPIPLPEGGFLKDPGGAIMVLRLDEADLLSLAHAGGGLYRRLDAGSRDVDAFLHFFDRPAEAAEQTGATVHIEQWREQGVWLLPFLLPLVALGFRRGWLGLLVLAWLPLPEPAAALEWQDLWLTPDQQAQHEFSSGKSEEAANRFQDPAWKAAAEYKAGHYEQAARRLESQDIPAGQYNRGNALARQGRLEDALKAYGRALDLDPRNEDAQYNRKLVEEALRKQQDEQKRQKERQQGQEGGQDQGNQPQQTRGQQGEPDRDPSEPLSEVPGKRKPQERNNSSQESAQAGQKPNPPGEASTGFESGNRGKMAPTEPEQSEQNRADAPPKQGQSLPRAETEPAGEEKPESMAAESRSTDETRQAEEQWLRRIPDDPGGLLRRKFYYQYQQRRQQSERNPW